MSKRNMRTRGEVRESDHAGRPRALPKGDPDRFHQDGCSDLRAGPGGTCHHDLTARAQWQQGRIPDLSAGPLSLPLSPTPAAESGCA